MNVEAHLREELRTREIEMPEGIDKMDMLDSLCILYGHSGYGKDIEEAIEEVRSDYIYDWLKEQLEQIETQKYEAEKEWWESGEGDYLLFEGDALNVYKYFPEDPDLELERNAYDYESLTALGIDLMDYVEWKWYESYFLPSHWAPLVIWSSGEIGELEEQVCKYGNEEMWYWYEQMGPDEQELMDKTMSHGTFHDDRFYLYVGCTGTYVLCMIKENELVEAIHDAEKDS